MQDNHQQESRETRTRQEYHIRTTKRIPVNAVYHGSPTKRSQSRCGLRPGLQVPVGALRSPVFGVDARCSVSTQQPRGLTLDMARDVSARVWAEAKKWVGANIQITQDTLRSETAERDCQQTQQRHRTRTQERQARGAKDHGHLPRSPSRIRSASVEQDIRRQEGDESATRAVLQLRRSRNSRWQGG